MRESLNVDNEGTSPQAKRAASPKPHSGNSFGVFEGLHEKAVNELMSGGNRNQERWEALSTVRTLKGC